MADEAARAETGREPASRSSLCLRLVVAVTMAGGLAGGGGIVAAIGLFRPDVTYMLLGLVPLLFVLGMLLGFIHGAALAWLGRPAHCPRGHYPRQLLGAALWTVPGFAVAAVITFWISYTTALVSSGRPAWIVAVVAGWIAAAGVWGWTVIECRTAARNVIERWPEHRLGITLIAGTFVTLYLLLPRWKFELRGAGLEFSTVGCAVVALALTLWVAAPVEVLLLRRLRRRLAAGRAGFHELDAVSKRPSLREAK